MNFKPYKLDSFINKCNINWVYDPIRHIYTFYTSKRKITIPCEDIVEDSDRVIEILKRELEIEEVKQ